MRKTGKKVKAEAEIWRQKNRERQRERWKRQRVTNRLRIALSKLMSTHVVLDVCVEK